MARYQVLYWKTIPSLVEASDGDRTVRVPLSQRFQDLIDAVAMKEGASTTEAYLAGWETGPIGDRPGSAEVVARAVATELEAGFQELAVRHLSPPVA
jgi:hypothetical protein